MVPDRAASILPPVSLKETLSSKSNPTPKRAIIGTAQTALGVVREVREEGHEPRPILICGQPAAAANARKALLADGGNENTAQLFALRRMKPEDSARLAQAALVVYAGEVTTGLDHDTKEDLDIVAHCGRPVVVVLEGLDVPGEVLVDAARRRGVEPGAVIGSRTGAFPSERLRKAVAAQAGDAGPALAARLPSLRPAVIERLVDRAALQNGMVAAAVWIPGVDMPVLTALELRLVMQIAACYGHELGADRALEIAGIVGAGFGLRTVARELLDVVPVAGWLIKGAVAYSGTRGIGKAAQEYFEHGAPADVSGLRARISQLRR